MPKRIPILAASDIAQAHDCRQVIVVAWDGERTHVVTYGATVEECDQAAQVGNRVKRAIGWPESLCNAGASRVKKLKDEVRDLKARLAHGDDVARTVNKGLAARVRELEALIASVSAH